MDWPGRDVGQRIVVIQDLIEGRWRQKVWFSLGRWGVLDPGSRPG